MTASVPRNADSWTFDDLRDLPDDGRRHELIDGRLLVSPVPALPHYRALTLLQEILIEQKPRRFVVGQNAGIIGGLRKETYLIPDLLVTLRSALKGSAPAFAPKAALLVVEVLSPGSRTNDTEIKRHYYARMNIPHYWIADPSHRQLHVMAFHDETTTYRDVVTVHAGEEWRSDEPFPITLDPAEFCH